MTPTSRLLRRMRIEIAGLAAQLETMRQDVYLLELEERAAGVGEVLEITPPPRTYRRHTPRAAAEDSGLGRAGDARGHGASAQQPYEPRIPGAGFEPAG